MIVEERIYVLHTWVDMKEYLDIYEREGLSVQRPILGGFLGYFKTEVGTMNQLVHLWAYKSADDRAARRQILAENAQWNACLAKIRPMIMTMNNRIMYPASFSPINNYEEIAAREEKIWS